MILKQTGKNICIVVISLVFTGFMGNICLAQEAETALYTDQDVRDGLDIIDELPAQVEKFDNDIKIMQGNLNTLGADLQEHHQAVTNQVQNLRNEAVQVEIEKALNSKQALSYFYLPSAYGGLIEEVKQTVEAAFENSLQAAQDVGNAREWIDRADSEYDHNDFKNAFYHYAAAYHEITK